MVFRERLPDGSVLLTGQIPPTMQQIIDLLYPVNSLHFTVNNVNPSTRLGGTWVAWGSGMVPVGVNAADSDFNVPEKVGGAKTHTLTAGEIPSHTHPQTGKYTVSGSHTHSGVGGGAAEAPSPSNGAASGMGDTGSAGGGGAHNNLQPYITCYMWKRTA